MREALCAFGQRSRFRKAFSVISIPPRSRSNQRHIHWLELKPWLVGIGSKCRFRRLQPVPVVALGKIWFVMGTARFVTHGGTLRDYPRQLQHVIELAREDDRGIGPVRAIAQIDLPEALQQFD